MILTYSHGQRACEYGDIGHVRDFYFNDQQWAIRYVVADTACVWILD
jgi:hypothetical protein